MRTRLAFALAVVAACGGDDTSSGPDASGPDAANTVHAFVPTPSGTCPTFAAGDVTVAPTGIAPRRVKVAMSASATPGPLIIYWHATGSNTDEAAYALGATLTSLVDSGAVVVAPAADPAAGQFPWYLVNQSTRQDDFLVADEIVGCLAAAGRIDTDRVHSMGMSAGALQSTGMTFLRSSYTASVVTYSGGVPSIFTPPPLDPDNKSAALIFHGGPSDMVFGVDFQDASMRFYNLVTADGHYAALCNHGGGHTIPRDAAPSAAQFFADNPFGAWPSPYAAAGLPASFPTYCAR